MLLLLSMTTPIVNLAARIIAVRVTPYFLKISDFFQERPHPFSFCDLSLQCASSSFNLATLPSVAFLSEGETSSVSMISWASSFSLSS